VLVGRDRELAQLQALLEGARQGRSAALIVHGEPGIG
jgi:predicted ATPase